MGMAGFPGRPFLLPAKIILLFSLSFPSPGPSIQKGSYPKVSLSLVLKATMSGKTMVP